ncbi:hypothetical protein FGIG_12127 [Fasciola gigantica]|uniref:Dynein light chain n=1 Tax=Fasciola gigantica TaxID=46835 RepID=A0A504Z344_FASGI|nr:hypothetical protein FGIG_12127 [Fasciola gigantica]
MTDKQASVKSTDMPQEMQTEVIDIAKQAVKATQSDGDIASKIKAALDEKFGETWHITVGSSFGSKVSHNEGHFIFFYLGTKAIQAYRFG